MRPPRGRGGFRGRGGGSRGGGRGGFGGRRFDEGPPAEVTPVGTFMHPCESEMVCKCTIDDKVPYFNAPVYLENKTKIGKIEEVLGTINDLMFTVKPDDGVVATSFKVDDKVYISTDKLLPKTRFTNEGSGGSGGRGGARGGRGGRGGARGGRGGRGGFGGRGGRGGFGGRGGRGGFGGRGGRGGFGRGRGRGGY